MLIPLAVFVAITLGAWVALGVIVGAAAAGRGPAATAARGDRRRATRSRRASSAGRRRSRRRSPRRRSKLGPVAPPVGRGRAGQGPAEAPQRRLPPGAGRRGLLRAQGRSACSSALAVAVPAAVMHAGMTQSALTLAVGGRGAGVLPAGFRRGAAEEEAGRVDLPRPARRAGPDGRLRRGRAGPRRGDAPRHRRAGPVLRRCSARSWPSPTSSSRWAGRARTCSATWASAPASRTSGPWPR